MQGCHKPSIHKNMVSVKCKKAKYNITKHACTWNVQTRQTHGDLWTAGCWRLRCERGGWSELGGPLEWVLMGMEFLSRMIKMFLNSLWWGFHNAFNIFFKNPMNYTLSGWIVWYVDSIPINLLFWKTVGRVGKLRLTLRKSRYVGMTNDPGYQEHWSEWFAGRGSQHTAKTTFP